MYATFCAKAPEIRKHEKKVQTAFLTKDILYMF